MSNNKSGGMGAKGYYIALVLCAVAIGISGFLFYRNSQDQEAANLQQEPSAAVQAAGTRPSAMTTPATDPVETTVPPTQATAPQAMKTAVPVQGEVAAPYAMEALAYNETTRDWRVHMGIDYTAAAGTPVTAAADGEVYSVYEDETTGMNVVIRHAGGYSTRYASLADTVSVKPGDMVKLGQTIGHVGSTALLETAIGDHVCFSVSLNGETIDPAQFLS